ncbi:hypothetical protein [uncultured Aquimarina sp.]|uniref:hypothetical protein n=1 Tax=uncultured Aquimarina sp. TaxID=575652 RepID=UPI0026164A78|nr:hypothetical protein [uncultured Aquimarina sp.]
MQNSILSIEGVQVLSKKGQKAIKGAASEDPSLCGCSCSGSVTGPAYCRKYVYCPQIYTCEETF